MKYKIEEAFDGRLPEYNVLKEDNTIIKTFDSIKDAEDYISFLSTIPCGEENPCND